MLDFNERNCPLPDEETGFGKLFIETNLALLAAGVLGWSFL
jgi:hypothetical protein